MQPEQKILANYSKLHELSMSVFAKFGKSFSSLLYNLLDEIFTIFLNKKFWRIHNSSKFLTFNNWFVSFSPFTWQNFLELFCFIIFHCTFESSLIITNYRIFVQTLTIVIINEQYILDAEWRFIVWICCRCCCRGVNAWFLKVWNWHLHTLINF